MLRYFPLFAGIDAFGKGLKNLGIKYKLVGFSEIDKFAVQSLCAIHGVDESLNYGDIAKCEEWDLPNNIDLLTHGSPCQSFSLAGRREGGDEGSGTQSSLMWYTVKIIERAKPKYVIWENVKAVLSKSNKHNFDKYWNTLEELGYTNHCQEMNAKDYGIPQNRPRVFVVSIRNDVDKEFQFNQGFSLTKKLRDFLEDEVDEKYYLSEAMKNYIVNENEKWTGNNNKSLVNKTIASTINTAEGSRRCDASNYICRHLPDDFDLKEAYISEDFRKREFDGFKDISPCLMARDYKDGKIVLKDLEIRRLTERECWRLQGFTDEDVDKCKAVGISRSQLIKQAGNSIAVPCVQIGIFENLFSELIKED